MLLAPVGKQDKLSTHITPVLCSPSQGFGGCGPLSLWSLAQLVSLVNNLVVHLVLGVHLSARRLQDPGVYAGLGFSYLSGAPPRSVSLWWSIPDGGRVYRGWDQLPLWPLPSVLLMSAFDIFQNPHRVLGKVCLEMG